MDNDEQLVAAAQAGSDDAFTELVSRYRTRLFRFLLSRSVSHADAEDAIQDTFVSAYRYLHSYDPRWRFSTWLYRIAIRNAARERRPAAADHDELSSQEAGPLEACADASERQNLWLTAKKTLSTDAYAALWLHYVEELPVREVAAALDRSLSWTKVNLHRSRRRLQAELASEAGAGSEDAKYG